MYYITRNKNSYTGLKDDLQLNFSSLNFRIFDTIEDAKQHIINLKAKKRKFFKKRYKFYKKEFSYIDFKKFMLKNTIYDYFNTIKQIDNFYIRKIKKR